MCVRYGFLRYGLCSLWCVFVTGFVRYGLCSLKGVKLRFVFDTLWDNFRFFLYGVCSLRCVFVTVCVRYDVCLY